MTQPLVSVIMPSYHRPMLLRERAIPSVLRQTYPNWELIVVGDGPATTVLADIVRAFDDPRMRYAEIARPDYSRLSRRQLWFAAGAAARNHALTLVRGDVIAPLDDDDEFMPRHLAESVAALSSGTADLVYGKVIARDMETGQDSEDYRPWHEQATQERFLRNNVIYNCSVCYSARFAHLRYHDSGDVACDYGLWRDIRSAGGRFTSLETPQAIYYGNDLASDLRTSLPSLPRIEAFHDLIDEVFERRTLSGGGEQVQALERALADRLGPAHAVPVANGDLALRAAFSALRSRTSPNRRQVVMPSYAPPSLAAAALGSGLEPVFCDVDADTLCITPETVRAAVGNGTAIIAAVHPHGFPADMDGLAALADEHDLMLMADGATALGASVNGRMVGSFGLLETLDLDQGAVLTAGEGGVVCTRDAAIADAVRRWAGYGVADGDAHAPGINARLGEIPAALARASMPRLERWLAVRRSREALYCKRLGDLRGLRFVRPASPGALSACSDMALILPDANAARYLAAELAGYRILTRPGHRPVHRMPAFGGFPRSDLAVTERLEGCVLCVPLYSDIREEVVHFVADAICEALR